MPNQRGNGDTNQMKKTSRVIDKIIIHCSATPPNMDIGVEEIRKWHTEKGWQDIGYHYVIRRNGDFQEGRNVDIVGAHVSGHNTGSIGICLIGGVDANMSAEDNFTQEQWRELRDTLRILKANYPRASTYGHNEFANKACPSFDAQHELREGRLTGT